MGKKSIECERARAQNINKKLNEVTEAAMPVNSDSCAEQKHIAPAEEEMRHTHTKTKHKKKRL